MSGGLLANRAAHYGAPVADKGLLTAFAEGEGYSPGDGGWKYLAYRWTASAANSARSAKAINFGLIYGMSAFGLARQLNIPRKEAREVHGFLFRALSGLFLEYMERTRAQAKEQGYVETWMAADSYLPDIKSSNARSSRRRGACGD